MYWGDYLGGTMHFTTFQHGCYTLLIGAYWQNGGPIPNDPTYLAQVCRTTSDKLARWAKPVLAKFTCKDGLLHHERVDFELLRSSARLAAAVANGRAGGLANRKLVTSTVTKKESKKEKEDAPQPKTPPSHAEIESVVSAVIAKNGRPYNRLDYSDPKVRKARWEQKMCELVNAAYPEAEAARIIAAYALEEDWAKALFNQIDEQARAAEARHH